VVVKFLNYGSNYGVGVTAYYGITANGISRNNFAAVP
jgi:hypothetical protein